MPWTFATNCAFNSRPIQHLSDTRVALFYGAVQSFMSLSEKKAQLTASEIAPP